MDSEKAKSLCMVVETGSVSEAAARLYCSQPAVSKQIAALEAELGGPLFIRRNKRLVLNESGKKAYAFAKRYLSDLDQLQRELRTLRLRESGCVRFGATNFVGAYLVPPALARYTGDFPGSRVALTVDFASSLLEQLIAGEISFALMPESPALLAADFLALTPVGLDEMALVCPPDHPLAKGRGSVQPKEVVRYPLLIPMERSATRQFVLERLEQAGAAPRQVIDLGTIQGVKRGVMDGMGVGILPARAVETEAAAGLMCVQGLGQGAFQRTLYLARLKTAELSKEDKTFIRVLENVIKEKEKA